MLHVPKTALAALLALIPASALNGQQRLPIPPESALPTPPYADYADLVVAAPVIIDATVRSELRLKPIDAPGLPPGEARLYIEADVMALIRGPGAVATRVGYTIDVPLNAQGRPPRYRKSRVLLFARGVAGTVGQVQLVRRDGQRGWTPGGDALTRQIVRETLAPDAPPTVTGIGNAFHTPGTIPGEGATQIFLSTADGRPISLGIVRQNGQPPHWSVALGEVVGEGNPPPPRDTLLWYRLACTLPPTLPDAVLTSNGPDAEIARQDYALVVQTLGTCDRGGRP
ncbi:hypothetical protein [Sphingomonas sp.]|uniref:hypothetical protein n=1 Tax=Sphingomonas sp. TaxID=28214 RepID=UPI0033427DD1